MPAFKGQSQAKADRDPNEADEGDRTPTREAGTGALCPEAQADGVPCFEIGRDCETCEKARQED
jgi:hypothetical protein